jgi:S1-C subfamily serine protease
VDSFIGIGGAIASGTGMVLSPTGEVLTNSHVVAGGSSLSVQMAGTGRTYAARVVNVDTAADVALLQLQGASGLRTVPVGDSSKVAVGDRVVALGNAFGRAGPPSVSQGSVVALNQSIVASDPAAGTSENLTGLIQTTARLQPGDSGGPLVDATGRVIGMDTAASARLRLDTTPGVGFAIPINRALSIAARLRTAAPVAPAPASDQAGYLGVEVTDPTSIPGYLPSIHSGAAVVDVIPGSPAELAGLTGGDIIVSVDGAPVRSPAGLTAALRNHHPGDVVRVGWVDEVGGAHSATMRLAARSGA